MSGRTVYRNRSFALLIAVVAGLFAVASVVSALTRTAADDGGTLSPADRWIPVVPVLALSLFCLLRLARAGVYADERGIRIVNPLRTVRLSWERLLRFALRDERGFSSVAVAELRDGSRVRVWGIQSRTRTPAARRVPEELVAQLNERLAHERARASALEHRRPPG